MIIHFEFWLYPMWATLYIFDDISTPIQNWSFL